MPESIDKFNQRFCFTCPISSQYILSKRKVFHSWDCWDIKLRLIEWMIGWFHHDSMSIWSHCYKFKVIFCIEYYTSDWDIPKFIQYGQKLSRKNMFDVKKSKVKEAKHRRNEIILYWLELLINLFIFISCKLEIFELGANQISINI